MTVTEKVAYLKGLMEGLSLDVTTNEGRMIKAIVDVLDDIALTVADLEDANAELVEQLDAIDEDLEALEDEIYDDDDDCCDCGCEDDDDEEDEYLYEVTCNKCNETFCLDEDTLLSGPVNCPNCNEEISFEVVDCDECDDDDCDCCGHNHDSAEE